MQPNYPQAPNDPYAFITNSAPSNKPSLLKPSTMKGRIILVSILAFVILVIAIVFMSFLNNGAQKKANQLLEISKSQTEIIRLSGIAQEKATSLETKSFASTIKLSLISSQSDINQLVTSNGISTKKLNQQLTLSKNTKSDEILDQATKNNRFDQAYTELIKAELDKYQKQLNSVASGASTDEKNILELAFNQSSIISGKKTSNTN